MAPIIPILTILVTATGVYVAWFSPRSALRRKLIYRWRYITPVLNKKVADGSSVQVMHNGSRILSEPHLAELEIQNASYLDISRKHFDGEVPIVFDLGAEVVEIVDKSSNFSGSPRFREVVIAEDNFTINPMVIPKRKTMNFLLLTEGRPESPSPTHQLTNTSVVNLDQRISRLVASAKWSLIVTASSFLVYFVVYFLYSGVVYGFDRLWHNDPPLPELTAKNLPIAIWVVFQISASLFVLAGAIALGSLILIPKKSAKDD